MIGPALEREGRAPSTTSSGKCSATSRSAPQAERHPSVDSSIAGARCGQISPPVSPTASPRFGSCEVLLKPPAAPTRPAASQVALNRCDRLRMASPCGFAARSGPFPCARFQPPVDILLTSAAASTEVPRSASPHWVRDIFVVPVAAGAILAFEICWLDPPAFVVTSGSMREYRMCPGPHIQAPGEPDLERHPSLRLYV